MAVASTSPKAPDIVYVCRPGDDNEELRYSLRSLSNLSHGKVFVAGYCPSWVSAEVERIPVPQMRDKHTHALASLIAAMDDPRVSDPFLMFNDDFYIMHPMDRVPILHTGSLQETIEAHVKGTSYREAMERTAEVLEGFDTKGYEVHCPMEFEKVGLGLVLSLGEKIKGFQYRTAYGNLMNIGGIQCSDVKVYRGDKGNAYASWALLSTSDRTFKFHPVGRYIRETFKEASPYESKQRSRGRAGTAIRYSSVVVRP